MSLKKCLTYQEMIWPSDEGDELDSGDDLALNNFTE